jgi:hypothetical protein
MLLYQVQAINLKYIWEMILQPAKEVCLNSDILSSMELSNIGMIWNFFGNMLFLN